MDKAEFTRRVLAAENQLYRVSSAILREPQDRMDAVQEAVLKAWAGVGRLRDERWFETWLTRILINECHNIQRRGHQAVSLEDVAEPVAPDGADPALHAALMALREELRLPVTLFYMEGYRVREISKILRIPEGTVKTRLVRARRELKKRLEED